MIGWFELVGQIMKRRRFLAQTAVGAFALSGFSVRAFAQDAPVEPDKVPAQSENAQPLSLIHI